MLPEQPQGSSENTYVVDAESAIEMARLLDQDVLLTESMGGIFPEHQTIDGIYDIVDIACGPGGWVQDVALNYPEIEVTGIDISQKMIAYAKAQIQVRHLTNAHFQVMNVLEPLPFPDASFDLVNIRLIIGVVQRDMFSKVLAECYRILRPNGILRWTEVEAGNLIYAPAVKKLTALTYNALYRRGYGFSTSGESYGLPPKMRTFLRDLGMRQIQQKAHVLDVSAGASQNQSFYDNMNMMIKLFEPFVVNAGLMTEEEVDQLHQEVLNEIRHPDFFVLNFILTIWGIK
jgi:ubiquinone/menaquinone biosynthesis C-methylase UbiE